ncbi:transposase [Microbulbifer sp. JMSA003]|uniref:transposase n=1 Tax=Microbulbifer sp. JMSA003 TaxID=3243369 RepID=UPI0040399A98
MSQDVTRQGKDDTQPEKQRYRCKGCQRHFDDLTLSVFSGCHQPLKVWVHCLYLMLLNLSNLQVSKEFDLNKDDVQKMTLQLRKAVCNKAPDISLEGEVECDEVYIVAGHKRRPEAVKKRP